MMSPQKIFSSILEISHWLSTQNRDRYFKTIFYNFVISIQVVFAVVLSVNAISSGQLDVLMADMRHYKTISNHRGHLYEHSLWTEQYISQWAEGQGTYASWMKNISQRERYILALAGLLHDIGKAGDLDCAKFSQSESFKREGDYIYYWTKLNHERIGFDYVLHDIKNKDRYPGYQLFDCQPFDFNVLFQELQIADQEQKLIAILIGCHRGFMTVVLDEVTIEQFFELIAKLRAEACYFAENNEKIVELAMILSIADVRATFFPFKQPQASLMFGEPRYCESRDRFKHIEWLDNEILRGMPNIGIKVELMHNEVLKLFAKKRIQNIKNDL